MCAQVERLSHGRAACPYSAPWSLAEIKLRLDTNLYNYIGNYLLVVLAGAGHAHGGSQSQHSLSPV